uniref:Mitogen-activated protein kinase n=1 Tax=Hirondellea gigas TaxID=1518452 RepID=A0A6A7G2V8_9CRUS
MAEVNEQSPHIMSVKEFLQQDYSVRSDSSSCSSYESTPAYPYLSPSSICLRDDEKNEEKFVSPCLRSARPPKESPSELSGIPEDSQVPNMATSGLPAEPDSDGNPHFPAEDLCGRYKFVSFLGSGSYGFVAEVKCLKSGERLAIKKIPNIFRNTTDTRRLLRELRILRMIGQHDKIVRIMDILPPKNFRNFDSLYIVFDFVDTDLDKLVRSNQYFSELHVQYILYQLLIALKYIHSAGIFHRDLKPANILLNEDCSLKLCDFGLARGYHQTPDVHINISSPFHKTASSRSRGLTRHVVTRWYRAPEVILLHREYSFGIDMWSVGCIFAELLGMQENNVKDPQCRIPLFPGDSCYPLSPKPGHKDSASTPSRMFDQMSVILQVIGTPSQVDISETKGHMARRYLSHLPQLSGIDYRKRFPGSPPPAIELLKGLLCFNPNKRLTVDEALAHPFLRCVRQIDYEFIHPVIHLEFEAFSMDECGRDLIIQEILHYNPQLTSRPRDASLPLLDRMSLASPPERHSVGDVLNSSSKPSVLTRRRSFSCEAMSSRDRHDSDSRYNLSSISYHSDQSARKSRHDSNAMVLD